ncbi:putative leucine-rich repeat protein, partial [Trypanosoma cruzi]
RLPHCMGCCKAMLCATRLCCGCHAVEIFDVVEVPPEGGGGDPPARVITDGFTRPFEPAVPSLYFYELAADIAEYIQVATVLHTFKVLSSAPSTSAFDRPVPLKDLGGGSVQFVLLLESIPPFLSARHAHTVTLRSLPSMGGKGDDEPRETVALFCFIAGGSVSGSRCISPS